jgi:type IV pilus assembly protein PilW
MTDHLLHSRPLASIGARLRQGGFGLVELMVALGIALFIAAGLAFLYVNMKSTFNSQDQMSQLQDAQRLALTMLTTTVQSAGYFPGPSPSNTANMAFPADGSSFSAGQGIVGSSGTGTSSDTVNVRYQTAGSTDALMNCQGATATAQTTWVNSFAIDDSSNTLTCAVIAKSGAITTASAAVQLVSNVSKMSVLYGVDIDGDGNTDTYLPAGQITPALWPTVRSARFTLTFVVPPVTPGGTPATQTWTQTIRLMNNP